ncbi:DinB family protein [Phytomonospora endophytica]|uniref:DinB family protein n=1 Tax=Phytomonospora endophytica TaxID=714109 RepID=A0A841G439_9ACTN|nr:DinB family protein [Phytomonospora endophytica]MBB6038880.1 hypothetical protein [Phytomonospora endophytica]
MDTDVLKDDLREYLAAARAAVLWKLDGLSEYDARRPLTPTGTNLLGLVKHLTGCEMGWFGQVFARPLPGPPAWYGDDDAEDPNLDMWARPEESREDIVATYRRACAHADTVIGELPLDAVGHLPSRGPDSPGVTLHRVLVHMIAETERHAGHADIVRELLDGAVGRRTGSLNLPERDEAWWAAHRQRIEDAAATFG